MRYLFLIVSFFISAAIQAADIKCVVVNPLDIDRINEPVSISIDELRKVIPGYKNDFIAVFDEKMQICSQLDDFDGDGKYDELAFMLSLKAKEKKTLRIVTGGKHKDICEKGKVHVQMFFRNKETNEITPTTKASSTTGNLYRDLHHHGPAWETELIAYRAYFDNKQTIDVYGKYKKQLELAESKWYPTDEQLAKGFGDDILLVKGSVGVGTLKGWDGEQALHISPVSNREARIVADGPLRTVVDMRVQGWQYMNDTLNIIMRYISYAGHKEVETRIIADKPFSDNTVFSTGVQKIQRTDYPFSDEAGLTTTWGTYYPVNDTVKYGMQTVGLAVAVPNDIYYGDVDDKVNHLVLLKPGDRKEFTYYFWGMSEKEEWGVKTAKDFFDQSAKDKWLVLNPLKVELKK